MGGLQPHALAMRSHLPLHHLVQQRPWSALRPPCRRSCRRRPAGQSAEWTTAGGWPVGSEPAGSHPAAVAARAPPRWNSWGRAAAEPRQPQRAARTAHVASPPACARPRATARGAKSPGLQWAVRSPSEGWAARPGCEEQVAPWGWTRPGRRLGSRAVSSGEASAAGTEAPGRQQPPARRRRCQCPSSPSPTWAQGRRRRRRRLRRRRRRGLRRRHQAPERHRRHRPWGEHRRAR